jgi:hypothetical protein
VGFTETDPPNQTALVHFSGKAVYDIRNEPQCMEHVQVVPAPAEHEHTPCSISILAGLPLLAQSTAGKGPNTYSAADERDKRRFTKLTDLIHLLNNLLRRR